MNIHKIEVTLTEDDYVAFNCFVHSRLKATRDFIRKNQMIGWILILFMLSFHLYSYWNKMWSAASFVNMFLLGVVYVVFVRRIISKSYLLNGYYKQIRNNVRELQGDLFDEPETIELREDGVFNQHVRGQSIFPYTSFGDIVEDNGRIYISIGKDRAFILPRDRIPAETLDAFLLELKKRKGDPVP